MAEGPIRAGERRLAGGNLSKVSKVGSTVRRPVGPHTSAVHALLAHVRAAGFEGAPEPLGIDERGREVLGYVSGRIHMPQRDGPLGTDAAVAGPPGCCARSTMPLPPSARLVVRAGMSLLPDQRRSHGSSSVPLSCVTTTRLYGTSSSTGDDLTP
jgi:hypothetical protein